MYAAIKRFKYAFNVTFNYAIQIHKYKKKLRLVLLGNFNRSVKQKKKTFSGICNDGIYR